MGCSNFISPTVGLNGDEQKMTGWRSLCYYLWPLHLLSTYFCHSCPDIRRTLNPKKSCWGPPSAPQLCTDSSAPCKACREEAEKEGNVCAQSLAHTES